jgi:biopolymer transport protein TolQ
MNVAHDLSFLALISNASLLVKLVMLILLGLSVVSWWHMIRKYAFFRETLDHTEQFEKTWQDSKDYEALYRKVSSERIRGASTERIFEAGFREFTRQSKRSNGVLSTAQWDRTRRVMRAAFQKEMTKLETNLSFLATVSSVSPYIGLFGTVWGIMNSFRGLATVGQASLASVAPGIAEALVATAMGLFAAIPALIGFNHLLRRLDGLSGNFEGFIEEFSDALQTNATGGK